MFALVSPAPVPGGGPFANKGGEKDIPRNRIKIKRRISFPPRCHLRHQVPLMYPRQFTLLSRTAVQKDRYAGWRLKQYFEKQYQEIRGQIIGYSGHFALLG